MSSKKRSLLETNIMYVFGLSTLLTGIAGIFGFLVLMIKQGQLINILSILVASFLLYVGFLLISEYK